MDTQRAEVVNEPLGLQEMRVHHGSLYVVQVRVVFECALQQASLLAELRNVGSVVVREHAIAEYGVSNLVIKI